VVSLKLGERWQVSLRAPRAARREFSAVAAERGNRKRIPVAPFQPARPFTRDPGPRSVSFVHESPSLQKIRGSRAGVEHQGRYVDRQDGGFRRGKPSVIGFVAFRRATGARRRVLCVFPARAQRIEARRSSGATRFGSVGPNARRESATSNLPKLAVPAVTDQQQQRRLRGAAYPSQPERLVAGRFPDPCFRIDPRRRGRPGTVSCDDAL